MSCCHYKQNGNLVMKYSKKYLWCQLICFVILTCGISVSSADSERISPESGLPTPLYRSMGQPLTDIEKMELHQRRFIDAANSVAKLFSQFDQRIHEFTRTAKDIAAYPYNDRIQDQLLYKARQIENAQKAFGSRYSQLQAKMQYEFSNFIAVSDALIAQQSEKKTKLQNMNKLRN